MLGWFTKRREADRPGFLARLRGDVRGNTLALLAAAMLPMCALAGSAIDTARLYVVKVRLQQACDAGVLAGRKFMTDYNGSTLDATATQRANTFFANNFKAGWMTTTSVTFTPSKTSDNQVAGTASAAVPMSLMKMFGFAPTTINVVCQARYDLADIDLMFVLDTTGSMACAAADSDSTCNSWVGANSSGTYARADGSTAYYVKEKTNSRIAALRTAVVNFYDTLAGQADASTHIRYGFVPYTAVVNAGKIIPSDYVIGTNWNYESRVVIGDATSGTVTYTSYTNKTSAQCDAYAGRSPASGYNTSTVSATVYTVNSWTKTSGSGTTALGTCSIKNQPVIPKWRYQQVTYDVSGYVTGNSVNNPATMDAATSKWEGCLEERDTTAGASSFDLDDLPPDLDPDLTPSDDASRWRPYWPEVIYYRGSGNPTSNGDSSSYPPLGGTTYRPLGYTPCGKQAQRLQTMTRAQVSAYVNATDFKAIGGTYHDVGMLWGTRFISPTGPFAADTAAWPGRNLPNRFIIFMTDGDMAPTTITYSAYGVEMYDNRVTGGNLSDQTDMHNARFVAECNAAKARNITVFVIAFGQTLNSELTSCATPGKAYYASDDAALDSAFTQIASQVAMLRISK